jgi:hypothetical protein
MSKKGESYRSFIAVTLVGIFVAGFVIFGWNFLRGKNLFKSPEFDLSIYEDTDWYLEKTRNEFEYIQSLIMKKQKAEQKQQNNFELGYVYFKDGFGVEKPKQSIKKLLNDYFGENVVFEDRDIRIADEYDKVHIQLPIEDRQVLIGEIELMEQVRTVEVVEAPIWEIVFYGLQKEENIANLFSQLSSDVIVMKDILPTGYMARVNYKNKVIEETVLEELQKEYSDVLYIQVPTPEEE